MQVFKKIIMQKIDKKIYYGDNLEIMKTMGDNSVDLIYLYPPFNSNFNYNAIYRDITGKPLKEQNIAFTDTWELDAEKQHLAGQLPILMRQYGIDDLQADFWQAWIKALQKSPDRASRAMLAYIIYMAVRLLEMKRLLKATGSIYLHCDDAASHYLKILMDTIFAKENFRNEIIWKRTSSKNNSKRWGRIHDTIFFYTASDEYTWNVIYKDYEKDYIEKTFRYKDKRGRYGTGDLTGADKTAGSSGVAWRGINPSDIGRHWAIPKKLLLQIITEQEAEQLSTLQKLDILDKEGFIHWPKSKMGKPMYKKYLHLQDGLPVQDIISDIPPLSAKSKARMGFPTQKPQKLLERIIECSSSKGDVVFDPFCGCGTSIYAAEKLGRKWLGCDIEIIAIDLIKNRLKEQTKLIEGKHYTIDGIPVDTQQGIEKWQNNPFAFEKWIIRRVCGLPTKSVKDGGIDGRIFFETKYGIKEMLLSVKGGKLKLDDVRSLISILQTKEKDGDCVMAGFISIQKPTKGMIDLANSMGIYEYGGKKYPKFQILTLHEIMDEEKLFNTPAVIDIKDSSPQIGLI